MLMKTRRLVILSVLIVAMVLCNSFTAFAQTYEPVMLDSVPQVNINTNDGVGLKLTKEDGYVDATVTITDTDGTIIGGEAQVKVRGNSTAKLSKKPYTIKFTNKLDILGMRKAKKWALLANAFDPTLFRNYIALNTAEELGLEYTSQQRVVEVYMDGTFRGCFNLVEPIQEGKTRVDIDIESNDGKCDFMIEREKDRVEEDATYFTSNGIRFVCSAPDEPNEEQLDYIQSTMDDVIGTLINGTRAEIERKIDVESFAKFCLLNEYVKPLDFDYSSVFFYYKGGKLYAGPAWDYDLSMGNIDETRTPGHYAAAQPVGLRCDQCHLYQWLYSKSWFFDVMRKVYLENQDYLDSIGTDNGLIDYYHTTYARIINRNFKRAGWPIVAFYKNLNRPPFETYSQNADFLKHWCSDRANWLNAYYTDGVFEYILGDSNSDQVVNIVDVTVIQRHIGELSVNHFHPTASDVDGDGVIGVTDATAIQRYLSGLPTDTEITKLLYGKEE